MSSFRLNRRFEEEIAREVSHRAALGAIGEQVQESAEALAPVGPTGKYRDSFYTEQMADGVVVGNEDFASNLVEFGSANNPPYGVLRRAVAAAGLRLEEQ